MGGHSFGEAIRQTRLLFDGGAVGGLTDRELLARYAASGDEPAFAALVARHGPMVLRVGQAVLRDEHSAHDAFQATFLVLARKAGTLRAKDTIGPWLHEVARRVAACARSDSARRARHERRAAERSPRLANDPEADDLAPALHEEVGRLPERFRSAIVLCDLEGLTQEQAAARLGWPLGTVRSRLARGRDRLRGRLTRRGLAPPAILPTLPALSDATVAATARLAAGGEAPLTVRLLTEGGLRAMRLIRWKTAAALTLALGLAASGAGALATRSLGQLPEAPKAEGPAEKARTTRPPAEDFPGENQVIVRVAPSGTKAWAFSPVVHAWRTYRTPEGVKIPGFKSMIQGKLTAEHPPQILVAGPDDQVLAPSLAGEEIREIVAFNVPTGEWVRQALKEPAHQACRPHDGRRCAIYRVGRYLYGFSAATGRWEIRDIGEEADKDKHVGEAENGVRHTHAVVAPDGKVYFHRAGGFRSIQGGATGNEQMAVIRAGRYICGFSVPTGTWDVLDLGADNDNEFPFKPQPTDSAILIPRGDHLYHFNAATGKFQDIEADEPPAPAGKSS